MAINPSLLCFICYILHSDLLLVVFTVNKVANIILQLPVVYETESTTSCQYMDNN